MRLSQKAQLPMFLHRTRLTIKYLSERLAAFTEPAAPSSKSTASSKIRRGYLFDLLMILGLLSSSRSIPVRRARSLSGSHLQKESQAQQQG